MSKNGMESLEKWVRDKNRTILKEAKETIDSISNTAKKRLEEALNGIMDQWEIFNYRMPENLIDIIVNGGVIKAKNIKVDFDRSELLLSFQGVNIFHNSESGFRGIELGKGEYRVTLIVEKKEESP